MGRILAAADIGSNTVHLLVAEVDKTNVRRIEDQNEWLNLGEVVALEREIPGSLQTQLIETLDLFRKQAKDSKAEGIYVFATEAMRAAANSKAVLKRIKSEVGIEVDIVNAHREAQLSLSGVMIDCDTSDEIVVAEIGGSEP